MNESRSLSICTSRNSGDPYTDEDIGSPELTRKSAVNLKYNVMSDDPEVGTGK